MMRDEEYFAIKERAAASLRTNPSVTAVGLGGRERNGQPTGEIVIKVFVRRKKPAADVPPDQLIPAAFEGVPTDVVELGQLVPAEEPGAFDPEHLDADNAHTDPIEGGMALGRPIRTPGNGTLGCIVLDKDDGTAVYALTNQHVVAGKKGRASQSRPMLRLGTGANPAFDSLRPVGYNAASINDSGIDAALVRLEARHKWLPKIKEIGFVRGTHSVTLAESATQTYQVRKRGSRTGLTGGIVAAIAVQRSAFDGYKDFDMLIRPNRPAAPNENGKAYFAYFGDSGSVVVNDANEVVGLLWAIDKDESGSAVQAGVTPISVVLERFRQRFGLDAQVATPRNANPTDANEVQEVPQPAGAPLRTFQEGLLQRDSSHQRPLVGGSQISAKPLGFANAGTLGCLVRKVGDPKTAYALTSYDAMSVSGSRPPTTDTDVGQPDNSESCSLCCSNTFGEFEKGGPDIAVTPTAALIKLDDDQKYVAEIMQIGRPIQTDGVAIVDVNAGTAHVRKRGPGTRLTGGVVVAIGGLVGTLPANLRADAMLIRPNVNPTKPDQNRCFSHPIDRGAVIVNPDNHVVGLLYGEHEVVENGVKIVHGVATPIRKVFDQLNALPGFSLELAADRDPDTVHTTDNRVATEPEPAVVRPAVARASTRRGRGSDIDLPDLSGAFARLQEQLQQSAGGRIAIAAWREHRGEIRHLIDHNRKVATIWHRSGGPAILQALARLLQTPDRRMPRTVNGMPVKLCLERIAAAFTRFGSPALRSDVALLHSSLPSLGGLSRDEVLVAFGVPQATDSGAC